MRAAPLLTALLAILAVAVPDTVEAQKMWISGWGGVIMNPPTVHDAESNTEWDFGTSPMLGVSAQHLLGRAAMVGIGLAYSPVRYEVRPDTTDSMVLFSGRAGIFTGMVTGHIGAGGGGEFSTYLEGGIGALIYHIPGLDRWDPDFALRAGGGLEYRAWRPVALYVEWNKWWVFHQAQGVHDNTGMFSNIQIGARVAPSVW